MIAGLSQFRIWEYAVGHMKAKRSMILLSGLLLLMIFAAWAQRSDTVRPTCPPVSDSTLQFMLEPTAWVKAEWNAKTSLWEIDCTQMDAIANMPGPEPFDYLEASNGANSSNSSNMNAASNRPKKRRP